MRYARADTDKDGFLSKEELDVIFTGATDLVLGQCDFNQDGKVGTGLL